MGPLVTAAASVGVVALALGLVLVQPGGAWRAAAEHSRLFWLGWAVVSVAVGAAPFATGLGWSQAAWFAICCSFAAFQPAMIVDVHDVHRHTAMGIRARLAARRAHQRAAIVDAGTGEWAPEEPPPIRWRAPNGS